MKETEKRKLLLVFGYSPESLDCASCDAAFDRMFNEEMDGKPQTLLKLFLMNCSAPEFLKLKRAVEPK